MTFDKIKLKKNVSLTMRCIDFEQSRKCVSLLPRMGLVATARIVKSPIF